MLRLFWWRHLAGFCAFCNRLALQAQSGAPFEGVPPTSFRVQGTAAERRLAVDDRSIDDWEREDQSGVRDSRNRQKKLPAGNRGLRPDFLQRVQIWTLDECDRMARMGLLEDVKGLFPFLPKPQPGAGGNAMQVRHDATWCLLRLQLMWVPRW